MKMLNNLLSNPNMKNIELAFHICKQKNIKQELIGDILGVDELIPMIEYGNYEEKIKSLFNEEGFSFDGHELGLKEIPKQALNLKNGECLAFPYNEIKDINLDFNEMHNLKYLSFICNKFESIPESITENEHIIGLNFQYNSIHHIPDLSKMKSLNILDLHGNTITLDDNVLKIENLTKLSFNGHVRTLSNNKYYVRELESRGVTVEVY